MSITFTYRPLAQWPGTQTVNRQASRFKASFGQTLELLDREIWNLGGRTAVIEIALPESQIRRDGVPYVTSRPAHPGIIVSFGSTHGPLRYPCDKYTAWHDNLRAIALSLEALRQVDRYGVTRRAEQYRGWAQLPGPLVTPPPMTVEEASKFLTQLIGVMPPNAALTFRETFESCYRSAVKKLHPDANGGFPHAQWPQLQKAADLLKKHHGI
jgi:hypothetical protein